jgi:hypothetical protein
VRDEEHGLAVGLPEGEQAEALLVTVELVESRERLVHQRTPGSNT